MIKIKGIKQLGRDILTNYDDFPGCYTEIMLDRRTGQIWGHVKPCGDITDIAPDDPITRTSVEQLTHDYNGGYLFCSTDLRDVAIKAWAMDQINIYNR